MKDNDKDILHTWKEISQYLKHDARTCSKWEKELDLPIHRYDDRSSKSNVFAYRSELDEWLERRISRNGKQDERPQIKKRPWLLISTIAAFSIIATIATIKLTPLLTTKAQSKLVSIAILPIEALNLDEYDEYITEGVANGILNSLTVMEGIRANPGQESSEVDYIIKGKIDKNEDLIHLSLSLFRQGKNEAIWQNDYEGKLSNLFYIQKAASRNIYNLIRTNNSKNIPPTPEQSAANESKAMDAFLKGNYILSRASGNNKDPWKLYFQGKHYKDSYTEEGNQIAIELFRNAIELDPNLAQAYVGLASCYANYLNMNWDNSDQWLQDADSLLMTVQDISTDFPEYYSVRIKVLSLKQYTRGEDWEDELAFLAKEGVRKFPGHPTLNAGVGHWYYGQFGSTGIQEYLDLALDYYEKAHWLNPNLIWNVTYAEILLYYKEFYKALDVCNTLVETDSTEMAKFRLGEVYYYMGELDKSEAIFSQVDSSPEDKAAAMSDLARIAARRGDTKRAKDILMQLLTISPKRTVSDFNISSIYFGIGNHEEGFKHIFQLCTDPIWGQIRHTNYLQMEMDKNFEKFIKDGGLDRLKAQLGDD